MFNWLVRRIRREACRQLVVELMRFNQRDYCWDPVGSIDHRGIVRAIESVSRGSVARTTKSQASTLFKDQRRQHRPSDASFRASKKGAV